MKEAAHASILIAEDDPVTRFLLRKILAAEPGWSLLETTNGANAWSLLDREVQPDVCILDIMMPELDGLSLLKRIRETDRTKQLPVIFCTSVRDRAVIEQVASLSVAYYVLKPFSGELVLRQVRQVLANAHAGLLPVRCWATGHAEGESYRQALKRLVTDVQGCARALQDAVVQPGLETSEAQLQTLQNAAPRLGADSLLPVLSRVRVALGAYNGQVLEATPETRADRLWQWRLEHECALHAALAALENALED